MYKVFIRPILFLFTPEFIHHCIIKGLKAIAYFPGMMRLITKFTATESPKLKRTFCGLDFINPIGMAAGFDKNADVYNEMSMLGFSFIEIGTVTPKAQPGNPKPRVFRLVSDNAIINRMGFNNFGVEYAVKKLKKSNKKLIVGGSIGKNTVTPAAIAKLDYVLCFNAIYDYVDYIAVNISCPNIINMIELQKKEAITEILNELVDLRKSKNPYKPILLKISPDVDNRKLDEIIDIFKQTGIDGIIATNTTTSRKGLSTADDLIKKIGNGGLSGKPLNNRSTEVIRYLYNNSSGTIPIMAVGGVMTREDAFEKMNAGAVLVQIYTGFIYNGPMFVKRINKFLINQ